MIKFDLWKPLKMINLVGAMVTLDADNNAKGSGLSLTSTPPECYAATPNLQYLSSKKM